MAMPNETLTIEQEAAINHAVQWVLEHLHKNIDPLQEDLDIISASPQTTFVINQLYDRWKAEKEIGFRKAFAAFREDHRWLHDLRRKELPSRDGTEKEQTTEQKPKRRIRFVDDEVIENMPAREWTIGGILPRSGVCMLFGPPETYKSFLAIDWSLSIGFGRGWQGRPVKKGGVAYIAGEGFAGLGARSKAWKSYHKQLGKSGVKWYGGAVDLTDLSSVNELYEALDEDFAEDSLELIVIDTFSRNSGGAEENSNTDVKKFMHTADLLQKRYKCTVLIIHHCGKNPEKGPRGASAFTGDTETIISVDLFSGGAMQGIKVGCYKQKDAEKFDPITLALHKVQYGDLSEEGSLVLIKTEVTFDEIDDNIASSKGKVQKMYEILIGKELTLSEWIALGSAHDVSEPTAKRARKELYDAKKVWYRSDTKRYYVPSRNNNEDNTVKNDDSNE